MTLKQAYDETWQPYREYRPTGFDRAGLGSDEHGIGEFYVMPVSRTRDSGPLAESNFEAFLDGLGGKSGHVQVHRFGHWGTGWFELILVSPAAAATLRRAYEMTGALEHYPVLDDTDLSNREYEAAQEWWSRCGIDERIRILKDYDAEGNRYSERYSVPDPLPVSRLVQARYDEIPGGLDYAAIAAC